MQTSVISVNQPDFVTVDAGLKALYYTPHAPPIVLNQAGSGWKYESALVTLLNNNRKYKSLLFEKIER